MVLHQISLRMNDLDKLKLEYPEWALLHVEALYEIIEQRGVSISDFATSFSDFKSCNNLALTGSQSSKKNSSEERACGIMEGYLKLKNGLDEINQLKQDLESMYNDQEELHQYLRIMRKIEGKLLENIPPLPNYERLDFVAKKTTEEGIILESLPCYEELNRGPEPSVNDKTSIAEVILFFLAFGFWIFLTITQFFYMVSPMNLKR